MQQGITKLTQINSSWTDITTSLVPVLQNMKTGNDGMECIEKQRTAIRMAIQLAHNQSENPMAQTTNGPPPQTSHAQSDPTTSARLRKASDAAEHTNH